MISHVCLGCGNDLAHVRAQLARDLWIVDCPRCGRRSTRWRHPLVDSWRRMRRAARAIGCLLFQGSMALFVVLAGAAIGAGYASAASDARADHLHELLTDPEIRRSWEGDLATILLLATVIVGLVAALWLRAGLAHWRWWVAWPAWLLAMLALVALPITLCTIDAAWTSAWDVDGPECGGHLDVIPVHAQGTVLVGATGLAFLPIAERWRRARERARPRRWRRLLRRRRTARGRS